LLQESIHDLVRTWESAHRASGIATPAYQALVEAAKRELDCTFLGLYIIEPASGSYCLVAHIGDLAIPTTIPALPRLCSDTQGAEVQNLLKEATALGEDEPLATTFHKYRTPFHVIGLRYRRTVYAYFVATAPGGEFPPEVIALLKAVTELAFLTFQDHAARNALQANEQPINITGDEQTFHEELRRFIVQATGMQLVAVRQRGSSGTPEEKNLRCTVVSGWSEPASEFDLIDYSRFPPFERAVANGIPLFSTDPNIEELQDLWNEHPHLRIVESFAVFPIKDDQRVIGVLSVATRCRLDFTPTFESIIGGIARSIGFTLKNRELHFEKTELQSTAIESAAAWNAVEIYSDLTHQMGNALATIPEVVEAISTVVENGRDIPAIELLGYRYLGAIEESHDRIAFLLTQAVDVASTAADVLRDASLLQLWKEACSLVEYRLRKNNIAVSCSRDFKLEVYPLQLRQVFFHLLLNSIDAFSSRSRRQPRRIDLHIQQPKGTRKLVLRYIDNAGGINPSTLRQRRGEKGRTKLPSVEQSVFLRGVSSREEGSGNGLWIARQILQRHHGGISLVEYHDGIVFDIELPLNLRELTSRRKEM
jgi:signal transduction histidine kinase